MNVSMKSDLHPYECEQDCVHCLKEQTATHTPADCAFCWVDLVDRCPSLKFLFLELFEPQKRLIGNSECLVLHGGNRYDICDPEDLSQGIQQIEYLDDNARGQWQVAYRYRLSGAHAGPPIEVLMVDPQYEYDEDGRNVCWERLLWADDQTEFNDDYLVDTYHDALIEDLTFIAKETWD